MLNVADVFRQALVFFLLLTALALAALFIYVLVRRAVDELAWRRQQRVFSRYRPIVDALLASDATPDVLARLSRSPARHRPLIGQMLLAPLRVATGTIVDRVRLAAAELGLVDDWRRDLTSRHWWARAAAARALGLVREPTTFDFLVAALDDDHEEVRAAAVEALGAIADARAVPYLLSSLAAQSRHQRVRVVEALARFGERITPVVVAYARKQPDETALIADLLACIGGTSAVVDLLAWTSDARPDVRAASWKALGSMGLDDKTYYYALRALDDPNMAVRSMAARALGRSRRPDAAPYLDAHLGDDWTVAAHCATALRSLGDTGLQAMRARAGETGQAGDLARQMVWQRQATCASGV